MVLYSAARISSSAFDHLHLACTCQKYNKSTVQMDQSWVDKECCMDVARDVVKEHVRIRI
jgi:hypothetical protein